ncbi:MAG: hypothetical protein WA364_25475, partial [Candidatus Nitrosopolaris sp.]
PSTPPCSLTAFYASPSSLARRRISYERMQALRDATIDENNVVQFIDVCYCRGGLYALAMEIPTLNQYFQNVSEVKDARFRDNIL